MYSIILPIRNEDESLPQLFGEIEKAMRGLRYEIIAVDDASGYSDHPGKWEALRAGLDRAKGTVIITMDADLQDDPGEIPKLLKKIDEGYDIVSGWRIKRQDPSYKIILTKFSNWIISTVTGHPFHDFSAPMKAYQKKALADIPKEGSLLRYSFFFAHKRGLRTVEEPIVHRPRKYGKSKFGLIKYFRIMYDFILIFLLFSGSGRIATRKH